MLDVGSQVPGWVIKVVGGEHDGKYVGTTSRTRLVLSAYVSNKWPVKSGAEMVAAILRDYIKQFGGWPQVVDAASAVLAEGGAEAAQREADEQEAFINRKLN